LYRPAYRRAPLRRRREDDNDNDNDDDDNDDDDNDDNDDDDDEDSDNARAYHDVVEIKPVFRRLREKNAEIATGRDCCSLAITSSLGFVTLSCTSAPSGQWRTPRAEGGCEKEGSRETKRGVDERRRSERPREAPWPLAKDRPTRRSLLSFPASRGRRGSRGGGVVVVSAVDAPRTAYASRS
jgi:hypothetical protein